MFTRTLALFLVTALHCCAQEANLTTSETADFKIRNEVFVGDSKSPSSSNLTLFQKRLVLDFRYAGSTDQISEITIFDTQDRSFVLLDVSRKLRLNIDNLQLLRILESMRKEITESPKVQHLLFEDATEEFDANNKLIKVASDRIQYELIGTRPSKDQILAQYLTFLENYTLLGVTDPTRMPPFARIRLNRAIKKFGLIPNSVSLTILDADGVNHQIEATSKHELSNELSDSDRQLVATARKYWMQFRQVGLSDYRSMDVANKQSESMELQK